MKSNKFVNFLAYISIALIAVVVFIGIFDWLINPEIISLLRQIALVIAEVITAVYAFDYAKSKKNIGWMIAYFVFIAFIIVSTILGFTSTINALKG